MSLRLYTHLLKHTSNIKNQLVISKLPYNLNPNRTARLIVPYNNRDTQSRQTR